jgi:hypothetical protein
MARITVHAVHTDGEPRRWTLSERIVAANLDSGHYVAQLIERLTWATADAEAIESPAGDAEAIGSPADDPTASRSRLATGVTT